jgi:hypothetical protein
MPRTPKTSDLRKAGAVRRRNDTSNTTRIDTAARRCPSMRIRITAVILISAIVLCGWSCSTKKPSFRPECPSLDAADYYFPDGSLDPSRSKIDAMLRDWYSQYLRAMLEPSLSCGERTGEFAYRFLWLRSFHHPICVRIEKNGSSVTLNAVELDGTGGHAPGGIAKRIQRALSPAEQDKFTTRLNRIRFWEMRKNEARFGLDGAQWILEGTENGRYQVVERWSPGPGAYRDLGLLLIEFTGITIPMLDYY